MSSRVAFNLVGRDDGPDDGIRTRRRRSRRHVLMAAGWLLVAAITPPILRADDDDDGNGNGSGNGGGNGNGNGNGNSNGNSNGSGNGGNGNGNGNSPPDTITGSYQATARGSYQGEARVIVSSQSVDVHLRLENTESGVSGTVELTRLPLKRNHFRGTGSLSGLTVTVSGRVDAPDGRVVTKARVLGTIKVSDGRHGRFAGERVDS